MTANRTGHRGARQVPPMSRPLSAWAPWLQRFCSSAVMQYLESVCQAPLVLHTVSTFLSLYKSKHTANSLTFMLKQTCCRHSYLHTKQILTFLSPYKTNIHSTFFIQHQTCCKHSCLHTAKNMSMLIFTQKQRYCGSIFFFTWSKYTVWTFSSSCKSKQKPDHKNNQTIALTTACFLHASRHL